VAVPHVKPVQVVSRAIHDKTFFELLKKDVPAALRSAGWTMADEDIARVQKALSSRETMAKFDLTRFVEEFHKRPIESIEWMAIEWFDF
jgi:hypothetical protein